jgi:hypothetical protein
MDKKIPHFKRIKVGPVVEFNCKPYEGVKN